MAFAQKSGARPEVEHDLREAREVDAVGVQPQGLGSAADSAAVPTLGDAALDQVFYEGFTTDVAAAGSQFSALTVRHDAIEPFIDGASRERAYGLLQTASLLDGELAVALDGVLLALEAAIGPDGGGVQDAVLDGALPESRLASVEELQRQRGLVLDILDVELSIWECVVASDVVRWMSGLDALLTQRVAQLGTELERRVAAMDAALAELQGAVDVVGETKQQMLVDAGAAAMLTFALPAALSSGPAALCGLAAAPVLIAVDHLWGAETGELHVLLSDTTNTTGATVGLMGHAAGALPDLSRAMADCGGALTVFGAVLDGVELGAGVMEVRRATGAFRGACADANGVLAQLEDIAPLLKAQADVHRQLNTAAAGIAQQIHTLEARQLQLLSQADPGLFEV